MLHCITLHLLYSPCRLVLSTRRVLATVLTILLQCFLSAVTSLSSASFIPVTSCISSIHFLLGRPLLLLPSPCASIILFSNPSDRRTCPKNPSFLLSAVCCSVSSSSIPISMRICGMCLFFFPFFLSLSTSRSHTELSGKLVFSLSFFLCLCSRVCLAITFLIQSLWLFLSPPFVLFPYHTFRLFPLLIPET